MAATFAELRSEFATRIALLSGWTLSPVTWHGFGPSVVPDAIPATIAHLAFAVGVPESAPQGDRQKPARGTLTDTPVSIKFLARHAPLTSLASEDTALAAELDLIQQLVATGWGDYHVTWVSSLRDINVTGEWFSQDIRFNALHRLALS